MRRTILQVGRTLLVAAALVTLLLIVSLSAPIREPSTLDSPLPTATPTYVISVTVDVIPFTNTVRLGQSLTVTASFQDQSVGCYFAPMEITLSQQGADAPIFDYVSPTTSTVGPPAGNPAVYLLRAMHLGTVTLGATYFGETYCGFWNWYWASGTSEPVVVWLGEYPVFLPLILKNSSQ